jgi:hypothetical protein
VANAADARLDAEFKRVRGLKDMHALYSKVPSAPATPSETIEAKAEGSIPYHPTIPGDDPTLPPFEKDYEEMETALVLYRRDTSRPGSPVFPGAFPPAEQTQQLQIDGKLQDLYVTTQETKATSTEELDDMSTPSISLSPSTQIFLPLDTVDGEDEEAPDTPQREVHLSPTEGPPRKPILVSSWPSAARFREIFGTDACAEHHLLGSCDEPSCKRLHSEIAFSSQALTQLGRSLADKVCPLRQDCQNYRCCTLRNHPQETSMSQPSRIRVEQGPSMVARTSCLASGRFTARLTSSLAHIETRLDSPAAGFR